MTIEEVIAGGLDVPREPGKPGPSDKYWTMIWPIIVRAAFEGAPCPRNQDIADAVGAPFPATASKVILKAQERGLLKVEHRGNVRRMVLPTGQMTAWSLRVEASPVCLHAMQAGYRIAKRVERERKEQVVFDILAQCARSKSPPPSDRDMAGQMGCSVKAIACAIDGLIGKGRMTQKGRAMGRSFTIPGAGIAERVKARRASRVREPKAKAAKPAKPPKSRSPKANWYMMRAANCHDDAARTAMHERATRVETVAVPATADHEHAAMLARFLDRGGRPLRCPDGFAVVRPIHEVMA